ncbi:hypothetical protein SCLCIDRAFT_1157437 [Scleroderma citrinum Foug A]|uniref:Uncharacterized protein n=1 Tax=Scleroderma citrinum Foug A TaxID=1036808 RepID=A0A0C3DB20_9AGAM|nr:hypothetical protein SCLCIDRAFT_1157437 [Scleroderma citrinum Foug A]
MCTWCIWVPETHQQVVNEDSVDFRQRSKQYAPYIVLGRFKLATCGHILAPRTLFIHFYLASIVSTFHAGIVQQSMADYFPNGSLDVVDIPFKFGTAEATTEYALRAQRLMQELKTEYDRIILILTDHSDEDTRDLFIGPDESGIVTSAPVDNFFHELLTPFQEVVHGSTMYIAACGSIVNNEESFNRMHSTIAEFHISNALAFDAPRLQTVNIAEALVRSGRCKHFESHQICLGTLRLPAVGHGAANAVSPMWNSSEMGIRANLGWWVYVRVCIRDVGMTAMPGGPGHIR